MIVAVLKFDPLGNGHGLFTEAIDLTTLGTLEIVRASSIEFNNPSQVWEVKSVAGEQLFAHASRQTCLAWEQQYFAR